MFNVKNQIIKPTFLHTVYLKKKKSPRQKEKGQTVH